MKRFVYFFGLFLASSCSVNSYAFGCTATAFVTDATISPNGFVTGKVEVRIRDHICDVSACGGRVYFRAHYTNRNGDIQFYDWSRPWVLEKNREKDVFTVNIPNCARSTNGPCEFNDLEGVEVTRVSCS